MATHSEKRDQALSIPLEREEREGDTARCLRRTDTDDVDQLVRLRRRRWRRPWRRRTRA